MSYGAKREREEWATTAWKVEGRQGPREGRATSFWQGPPSVILVTRGNKRDQVAPSPGTDAVTTPRLIPPY